jgi:predicted ATPase
LTIHQNSLEKNRFSRRKSTPIILIEEPEANLHPKLQSELVNMFLEAYEIHQIRFILETHSEYIIRKTQLVGLERNFFSRGNQGNPFKVYYFEKDDVPYEMVYTEQGRFERDFGEGFYDVSAKLTMETLKKSKLKDR